MKDNTKEIRENLAIKLHLLQRARLHASGDWIFDEHERITRGINTLKAEQIRADVKHSEAPGEIVILNREIEHIEFQLKIAGNTNVLALLKLQKRIEEST